MIYKKELMVDLGLDIENKTDDFSATKGLVHAVGMVLQKPSRRSGRIRGYA